MQTEPAKEGETQEPETGSATVYRAKPEDLAADDATVENETPEVESGVKLGLDEDQVEAKPIPAADRR